MQFDTGFMYHWLVLAGKSAPTFCLTSMSKKTLPQDESHAPRSARTGVGHGEHAASAPFPASPKPVDISLKTFAPIRLSPLTRLLPSPPPARTRPPRNQLNKKISTDACFFSAVQLAALAPCPVPPISPGPDGQRPGGVRRAVGRGRPAGPRAGPLQRALFLGKAGGGRGRRCLDGVHAQAARAEGEVVPVVLSGDACSLACLLGGWGRARGLLLWSRGGLTGACGGA